MIFPVEIGKGKAAVGFGIFLGKWFNSTWTDVFPDFFPDFFPCSLLRA